MSELPEEYRVDNPQIDSQHEALFVLIDNIADGRSRDGVLEVLEAIEQFSMLHFNTEEELLLLQSRGDFQSHRSDHVRGYSIYMESKRRFVSGEISARELHDKIRAWQVTHITEFDKTSFGGDQNILDEVPKEVRDGGR